MAPWLLWLIAAGLFAAGEVASLDLVLLMFAGGALGGMALALVGAAAFVQVIAFIVVSGRPAGPDPADRDPAAHPGRPRCSWTACDTVIGRTARVTRPVDVDGGRIRLGADEWSARTQHSGESFAGGADRAHPAGRRGHRRRR